jgi:hypothetical protein
MQKMILHGFFIIELEIINSHLMVVYWICDYMKMDNLKSTKRTAPQYPDPPDNLNIVGMSIIYFTQNEARIVPNDPAVRVVYGPVSRFNSYEELSSKQGWKFFKWYKDWFYYCGCIHE